MRNCCMLCCKKCKVTKPFNVCALSFFLHVDNFRFCQQIVGLNKGELVQISFIN